MRIVGLNAYHADAAAIVLDSGTMSGGFEEERFTRVKHWAGLPRSAVRQCLLEAGENVISQVESIAISRKPEAYIVEKAKLALSNPRTLWRATSRAKNLVAAASVERNLRGILAAYEGRKVYTVEHHLAHLASAFMCSPYEEAACLSADGFGDFVSTMMGVGRGGKIEVLDRVLYPHSLGLFYTAITQYLGFPKYGDEYKVMGLAAYGEPRFVETLRAIVPARETSFVLDLTYFRHLSEGVDMTWDDGEPKLGDVFTRKLEELLGARRHPDEEISQRHKDIAASAQAVYEERFFALVREVLRRTRLKKLALAGGCAMNSVANGKLFEQTDVQDVFIQPAAGDAGTALGAALYVQHVIHGEPRQFVMEHAYWGTEFSEAEIWEAIAERISNCELRIANLEDEGRIANCELRTPNLKEQPGNSKFEIRHSKCFDELCRETARAIADGEIVGWYQGRMEWGPRALGNRSILADPRRADMRDTLNLKIKHREAFRPFAPSILQERTGDWFTISYPDPFMLKVYPIRPEKRPLIPAVTHVDGTGRLQTVSRNTNFRYWQLIRAFEEITGVPILLNTSFNENEPIVNTPGEALDCFLRTRMDRLVMGNWVITRKSGPQDHRTTGPQD